MTVIVIAEKTGIPVIGIVASRITERYNVPPLYYRWMEMRQQLSPQHSGLHMASHFIPVEIY